jgi:formate hydrogenlyase transcriptional activator
MSTPERQSQAPLELRAFIDSFPGMLWSATPEGAVDYCNRPWLDFASMTLEQAEGWGWAAAIYPEDHDRVLECWRACLASGVPFDLEARMRRFDGAYRWFIFRANPVRNESGKIVRWYGTNIEIEDRKQREEDLRARELSWREIVDNIPGFVYRLSPTGEPEFINRQTLEYFGKTNEELKDWSRLGIVHPDDLPRAIEALTRAIGAGQSYEIEHRCRRADGIYRWFQVRGCPSRNTEDAVTAWYFLITDIDDLKRAEQKLQQNEEGLRSILDAIRQGVWVLDADGTRLYANRMALEITGLTMEDINSNPSLLTAILHPEDEARYRIERQEGLSRGTQFELEVRILHQNGEYRWFLNQYTPLRDEYGQVSRWYVAGTDIDEQKKTEERLRNENLVLREEIDRTSMFEEIVGSSRPMSQVLKQVEKVAPSDSTVLILGETGTGKELIARALHRRSKRANRAFVRVNCAAIPESLVASELFGHEKGAFTGALQRRVGRFEAADGGTLFLDEVGELPMDTQIALLRVLQEREFERVGSNHPISIDVRVIAATNRDLSAAVAAGTFRRDLFYRLNVFPIAIPPLRERAEDIPLLLEYFVARFAKSSGKKIRHIGKDTLRMMREYGWPGNIRELQNVVERAVILTETDTFFVDENWLNAALTEPERPQEGLLALADRELEMIEAALAECHGRISGPSGAAAKLGIPRQTLESKIRRLGIDRYGQKRTAAR